MNAIGGVKGVVGIVGLLVAIALGYGTVYTVPEGHVGIVKRFQKAVKMVDPGLHVKVPVVYVWRRWRCASARTSKAGGGDREPAPHRREGLDQLDGQP